MPSEFDKLDHELMSEEGGQKGFKLSYLLWFVGGLVIVFACFFIGLWYAYHHKKEIETKNSVPLLKEEGSIKERPAKKDKSAAALTKNMEVFNRLKKQDENNMKKIEQVLPPEATGSPTAGNMGASSSASKGGASQTSSARSSSSAGGGNQALLPPGKRGVTSVPTQTSQSSSQSTSHSGTETTTSSTSRVVTTPQKPAVSVQESKKTAPAQREKKSSDRQASHASSHVQGETKKTETKDSVKAGKNDELVKLFDRLQKPQSKEASQSKSGAKEGQKSASSDAKKTGSLAKTWQAQVGVTRSQDEARALFKKWSAANPEVFNGHRLRFEQITLPGKGVVYRMRVVPFSGYEDAKEFCDKVKSHQIPCLPMFDKK